MSTSRRRQARPSEPAVQIIAPDGRLSYSEKVPILLRESLIDAAADALARDSWSATRMVDIAAAVGVSRQTVYNEFGSKDELARALLLRETNRFLGAVEAALEDRRTDPVAGLTAALEVFLRMAEDEPLLRAILGQARGSQWDLGPLFASQGGVVLPFITDRLTERFLTDWPAADPARVHGYADTAVRLAISHVVLPSAEPQVSAAQVSQVLAPYLRQLTEAG